MRKLSLGSSGSTLPHRNTRSARTLRGLFTWRVNLYRLIVGALVLAIVIPSWGFGVQVMWLVAIGCILVVIGAVVVGTRMPSIREWLRR